MAALNEAVEVATERLGPASEAALGARGALSNTFTHFGHARQALQAIEPALAPARSAFGAMRPHGILLNIERFHADALARYGRPREAANLLRQVLVDQRALDAEETTRVRIAMTLLANALQLGGHLDEAQSLVAQSEALHERLTGGVNDEGIALTSRHSLICALRRRWPGALRHLGRVDALAAARGEADALGRDRFPVRVLVLATSGQRTGAGPRRCDGAASRVADGHRPGAPAPRTSARAAAHRLAGSGTSAAEAALSIAAEGGCVELEHGLALAEAARCSLAAGDPADAALQLRAALTAWEAGQVDGPELLQPVHAEFAALQAAH
jgi:hypothetical protein